MMTRRLALYFGVLAAVTAAAMAIAVPPSATAQVKGAINTLGSPGVAIKGYDPVAYFKDGRPRKGSSQHTVKHKGATWRFVDAENKAAFAANPAKYEPAYGGYCAYGVAQGYLVKIEPEAWAIRGGKLYLNYDAGVQRTWSKNPGGYIEKANARWPKLTAGK